MKVIANKKALEIQKIAAAAKLSTEILQKVYDFVEVGVTPSDIERYTASLCSEHNVTPAFIHAKDAHGKDFADSLCVSVNDAVLHGKPSLNKTSLKSGDVVKLDFGIVKDGFYTDQCVTLGIGDVSEPDKNLMLTGRLAVQTGLKQAVAGKRTGDIGAAIQGVAELAGYNVLRDYIGHGIGKSLWEAPEIPAYGLPGKGYRLEVGMVLSIEAQIVAGSADVYVGDDGWTVYTSDGEKGVMFEYMVAVQDGPPLVLTPTLDWNIISPKVY